jgi:2',3'-cyclic-nucleotide 2'-phosphodiesterase (5'-nucleotidase family)
MNKLRILHINDLHSHFGPFPRIERFFAEKSNEGIESLRFDLGDNVDRFHPLTEATMGKANVELMNRLNLTAATIGNNEGLGLMKEDLEHLYDDANFPVTLANIPTDFAQPYLTYTTEFGLKLAMIGLTAPYPLAYPPVGWDLLDYHRVLKDLLPTLDADFVILLSHLGIKRDEELAASFDIDLIIGAHTHHLLENGLLENGTYLAAAGAFGQFVGQIDLTFDGKELVKADIQTTPTNTLPKETNDRYFVEDLARRGHKILAETPVGVIDHAMTNELPIHEATRALGQLFADYAQVPAAILNSGLVLGPVPKVLNADQVHELLPHSMRLVRYTMSGCDLKKVLLELVDIAILLRSQRISGMGFRGKEFGDLVMIGIDFHDGHYYYEGKVIEDDATYQFVVPDQYYFARYFPRLKELGEAEILFPRIMREIVAYQLRESIKHNGK